MLRSAAILAGGRASRFGGRDKSALVVDGQAILDRQLAAFATVEGLDDRLMVGGTASRPGLRSIEVVVPGSGPLGGIHAALTHAAHDAVCIVACDMPYITAPFIERLFEELQNNDVVVPRTERGYHPLCAAYTRACQPALVRRLAERRLKMLDLFEDVQVHVVNSDDINRFGDAEQLLANVNTPDELQNVGSLLGHEL